MNYVYEHHDKDSAVLLARISVYNRLKADFISPPPYYIPQPPNKPRPLRSCHLHLGVLFRELEEHRVVEELVDRDILAESLSASCFDHEISG